jgi:RNA-directed DNA polymerase
VGSEKVFRTVGVRHWVFAAETGKKRASGQPDLLELYDVLGTPIRRHRKITADANPFDPQWESYFEQRLGFTMLDTLRGRKQLIRLWLDQERRCPVCDQLITRSSGWRLLHRTRVIDGGTDAVRNLRLLHPDCHGIARASELSVAKPALDTGL